MTGKEFALAAFCIFACSCPRHSCLTTPKNHSPDEIWDTKQTLVSDGGAELCVTRPIRGRRVVSDRYSVLFPLVRDKKITRIPEDSSVLSAYILDHGREQVLLLQSHEWYVTDEVDPTSSMGNRNEGADPRCSVFGEAITRALDAVQEQLALVLPPSCEWRDLVNGDGFTEKCKSVYEYASGQSRDVSFYTKDEQYTAIAVTSGRLDKVQVLYDNGAKTVCNSTTAISAKGELNAATYTFRPRQGSRSWAAFRRSIGCTGWIVGATETRTLGQSQLRAVLDAALSQASATPAGKAAL